MQRELTVGVQMVLLLCMLLGFILTLVFKLKRHAQEQVPSTTMTPSVPAVQSVSAESILALLSKNRPIIIAAVVFFIVIVLVVTVIIIAVYNISNYRPSAVIAKRDDDVQVEEQVEPDKISYWWLLPAAILPLYLTLSAIYLLYTEPNHRISILAITILLLFIYGLSVYQCYHNNELALIQAISGNLKWTGLLAGAYLVNRLFKGSLKDIAGELELFAVFFKTIFRLFCPFWTALYTLIVERLSFISLE